MDFLKRAWVEVSLKDLTYNYNLIKKIIPNQTKIMAVLKANAYNCGDIEIAKTLVRLDHTVAFAVSNFQEALKLREANINNLILILGYTPPELAQELYEYQITQTLISYEYAISLSQFSHQYGVKPSVHLKLDTGMGRMGIVCYDAYFQSAHKEILSILNDKNLSVSGCFTHIATLYQNDDDATAYTAMQYSRFVKMTNYLKEQGQSLGILHCLNSAGTANMPHMAMDMVRPGTLLYGALPDIYNHSGRKFKPILIVKASVAKVSKISKGSFIGYNRAYQADHTIKAAVLSIGYSDILRMGQGEGMVLINDRFCKVIGGVCMDQMVVDVTDAGDVTQGDVAVILGRYGSNEITLSHMSEFLKAGEEEIYCHITSRPDRVYIH